MEWKKEKNMLHGCFQGGVVVAQDKNFCSEVQLLNWWLEVYNLITQSCSSYQKRSTKKTRWEQPKRWIQIESFVDIDLRTSTTAGADENWDEEGADGGGRGCHGGD